MASTYKTPGVYVREVSKFPPSVAQVETAIPAFIGYTQKAKEINNDDLLNKPTRITSVLDFVTLFGGAPDVTITSINLGPNNEVLGVDVSERYYLYEAIRMFYANGGGPCYIVSVGKYGDTVQNGDGIGPGLLKGLDAIRKQDEPTILLSPDASIMSQADMNTLHTAMLRQCNDLQDRFCVFDLKENSDKDYAEIVDDFRDGIGMSFLKYGAAYTPWLKANLPRDISYKNLKGRISSGGSTITLADLVDDARVKSLADSLDNLVDDFQEIQSAFNSIKTLSFTSIEARVERLIANLRLNRNRDSLIQLLTFYVQVIDTVRDVIDVGSLTNITIRHRDDAGFLFETLQGKLAGSESSGAIFEVVEEIRKMMADSSSLSSAFAIVSASGLDLTTGSSSSTVYFGEGTNNSERISPHIRAVAGFWPVLRSSLDFILESTEDLIKSTQEVAKDVIPALKNIFQAIRKEYLTLPPSSSIAGVYALVDNSRGVWKAPANISLNQVVDVTTLIDRQIQDNLNIHPDTGKSINALRPFAGKGIMVWGARTLAGNDNEWRYISVRRFFNMAEESIKKATEQFVFEPNDANTWVKVRAMIENFLVLQWRAGALAGAKPDDAFYVRIGLGQTMTAQDILNGYMIVEIGMAVVRPAEFIILNFSHKMQES
ncbi:phage tail sheath family protein [Mongoliitalea daihaiensis]|uniref:phage tail sheath family protein n=1 Tax=Mongoliitalea daihaiensis TaxID=2782006 RepID=UPI001F1B3F85|nr:phage tail sheath C-terminal domain-containing protein [Mongoliitalea daihaiensis]UJP63795.1 phage tail sheath subtilisin-like domain-containing protein [Mongoliitalea daihaiensis]